MDHTAGASSQTSEPDLTRKRSVNLFDLPVYSNKNAIDGVLNKLSYASETTDVDGWKHEDCYQICGTDQEAWVRYELNGKYTMARGNLYDLNASGGSGWLEFYDGDDFLAVTPGEIAQQLPSILRSISPTHNSSPFISVLRNPEPGSSQTISS